MTSFLSEGQLGRLARWLDQRAPVSGALRATTLDGGYSNVTLALEDAVGRRWVLRMPPPGEHGGGAHDVGRESSIMTALAETSVPVPAIIGSDDGAGPLGCAFYVAELIEGYVLRTPADAERVTVADRRAIGEHFFEVLAMIHALGPDDAPIPTRSTGEAYVERQLRRWISQYHSTGSTRVPLIESVHAELARDIPKQQGVSLVHGDYHLENVIFVGTDLAAVLDWELASFGDPLADLGMALAYWSEPEHMSVRAAATDAAGFLRRSEAIERYARASSRDVRDIEYYAAFANWKIACIAEGVLARVEAGAIDAVASLEVLRQHPVERAETARMLLQRRS